MKNVAYSEFRANLTAFLNQVNDDHDPVLVTRQNGKPAVILSLEDFNSYQETAYLMSSATNLQRLNKAIEELEAGRGKAHDLDD